MGWSPWVSLITGMIVSISGAVIAPRAFDEVRMDRCPMPMSLSWVISCTIGTLTKKKTLLSKALAAVPSGGAVIVYEAIIDDERRENAFGLLMSLNMLIETPSGFDYTGADCQQWMRECGFSKTRVEHLDGPDTMVIGIK
jgi:hypothetical protein